MADPAVSNGIPVLPSKVVPYLTLVVLVALGLEQALPPHTVGAQIAAIIGRVGGVLGLVSSGWRAPKAP